MTSQLICLAFLLLATRTDLAQRRIPNALSATGALALALQASVHSGPMGALHGLAWALAVAAPLLIAHFANNEGMGAGDVKAAGVIGLGFGAAGLIVIVVAATLAALLGSIASIAAGEGNPGARTLPFAPFLLAGALATICLG